MEDAIKKYAERVSELKRQKTNSLQVKHFLKKEFDIIRLSTQKREQLNALFNKYNLCLNILNSTEAVDWITVAVDSHITISISENSNSRFKEVYELEVETTAIQEYSATPEKTNITLYPHQIEAIKSLTQFYQKGQNKKGLLVIPTGGGKTLVAVRWLLQNVINEGYKVIWIAHRHELLEQVKDTIHKNCSSELLPKRQKVKIHLISGFDTHHEPRKIDKDDDFVIASKDSLRRGSGHLISNYLNHNKNIFFVIDEAHHAVAQTYTNLINIIESNSIQSFNLLGLTATPFRTSEKEQTFLSKVFTGGIIFSTDLNKLIIEEILAKPIFEPIATGETVKKDEDFSDKDLKLMNSTFDLPENVKTNLASRKNRNNLIVETYDKEKYGKTLIFALNKDHAIAIDALLRHRNVNSKFIISGTLNQIGISDTNQYNKEVINQFREGKLDVLVNVNILTEGTDLPNANSVFLTRPTNSKVLMTQMIGRVLRGPKAGGTATAKIVSFIDNWDSLVSWISPKELLTDEAPIIYGDKDYEKVSLQIISIKLIEQFSLLLDRTIDTSELEALPAIQRIPVGWYSFEIEVPTNHDESDSRICKILVFENQFFAFKDLEDEIESLYSLVDVDKNNKLDKHEKTFLLNKIKSMFFDDCSPIPSVSSEDLINFIEFYDQTRQIPPYFTFEQRDAVNISKLVLETEKFNALERKEYIKKLWGQSKENSIWRELFNDNFDYFLHEINIEENKRDFGVKKQEFSHIEYGKEKLKDIKLIDWPEPYQTELRNAVFEKSKEDGYYVCQITKQKSQDKKLFHIDHIEAFSKGKNNTVLENLRIVKSVENWKKGDRES